MENRLENLIKGSEAMGLDLTEGQLNEFYQYKNLLQEWNKVMDITTVIEDEEVDIRHFLDSLSVIDTGLFNGEKSLIDIGTGGGFPGIPLKIYNPKLKLTLLDSLQKRIRFLDTVIREMNLNEIKAIHGRAEELGRNNDFREKYDLATSRAVARLNTLVEYTLPFIKVGGHFIAMKGPDCEEEINEAKGAINTLGCRIKDVKEVKVYGSEFKNTIIVIEKMRNTPKKYPRGGGAPRKKPL